MSILADIKVKELVMAGEILIDPYFDVFQGPNCYHCHLGTRFKRIKKSYRKSYIFDPLSDSTKDLYEDIEVKNYYLFKPGEFILAETFELFGTSSNYVIKLLNSSSIARVGISHAAVGMINAGCGTKQPIRLTLELINNSPITIKLKPTTIEKSGVINWGTEILKVSIMRMEQKPSISYDDWKYGSYSKDQSVTGTKMANRFDDKSLIIPRNSLLNNK